MQFQFISKQPISCNISILEHVINRDSQKVCFQDDSIVFPSNDSVKTFNV